MIELTGDRRRRSTVCSAAISQSILKDRSFAMYPFSGIKVVELATVVAAPTAARVLCDFGADVIKIESHKGDDMRSAGNSEHVPCTDDYNPLFTITNSNKKLIAINLKTAEGKELLKALLKDADVFITNIRLRSPPIKFADFERRSYAPTGRLGSDTDEILRALGYSAEAVEKFRELGCIK